jgi:hypothetical protein
VTRPADMAAKGMEEPAEPVLELRIAALEQEVFRPDHLPVRASFTNVGTDPVRLLRVFDPLPVFFEVDMEMEDGTPIDAPGMGKADLPRHMLRYVDLAPGQEFQATLRLDEVVAAGDVAPGGYTLSLAYHNQYGEDCFQGWLESNTIRIEVLP